MPCSNIIQPANITVTPMLGSTASPYEVLVNITQRLCNQCCVGTPPVFDPRFSVLGVSQVGKGQYVATLHVEGQICYNLPGSYCGCSKVQPLSQNFTVPISSDSAPDVTIDAGPSINTLAATACQQASRTFVSETPVSINVATAAAAAGSNG